MAILKIRNENGEMVPVPALVGPQGDKGEPGQSGVYVGSGEMPEGCNVQIDPDGEGEELATKQYVDNLFTEYVTEVAALVGGDA